MASTQSNNSPIVIVVVVICAGGLALLSLFTFVLFFCFQKRKEKTQETDIIHIDEHKKGKETVVPGPFGQQAVVISVEDDVHVDESKKSKKLGHGLHADDAKSSSAIIHIDEHKTGKETIAPGPFGQQAVVISVEDDVHVDESKKSKKLGHGLHADDAKSSSAIIHINENKKSKETIAPGPFGQQAVAISVEDDVHVDESKKNEKLGHGLYAKSSSAEANHHNSNSLEVGTCHGHHHQLKNKS